MKFFVAAGIPSTTSAKYAHVFYDNRIQMDMLTDLNKEYLREMGINTMGDIIAILRHAKNVYEQNAQEKALGVEQAESIPVAAVSARPIRPLQSSGKFLFWMVLAIGWLLYALSHCQNRKVVSFGHFERYSEMFW